MSPIKTYVFFDLETTGLPTKEDGVPAITELGMLAVKRKHLENRETDVIRVQNKFLMCFNPDKKMTKESVELSGLTNELLEEEANLNIEVFNAMNNFINCLQKPVCLIAHNGFKYHFAVLKYYFKQIGFQLSPDIKCTDSLYGFYDLLEAEKAGEVLSFPDHFKKPFSQLKRPIFYSPRGIPGPADKYILNNVYQRVIKNAYLETNRAQNHCTMIMEIARGRPEQFGQWVDGNHCAFSEVPSSTVESKSPDYI